MYVDLMQKFTCPLCISIISWQATFWHAVKIQGHSWVTTLKREDWYLPKLSLPEVIIVRMDGKLPDYRISGAGGPG